MIVAETPIFFSDINFTQSDNKKDRVILIGWSCMKESILALAF